MGGRAGVTETRLIRDGMMRKTGEEATHGDAVDGDVDAEVGGGKA